MSTRRLPRIIVLVVILSMLALTAFSGLVNAQTPTAPVVRALFFYSSDCPDCKDVIEKIVKPLQTQYGAQLDLRLLDIKDAQVYALLTQIETEFGITEAQATIPEAFLGNVALIGPDQVRAKLGEAVKGILAAGGADFPLPKQKTATPLPVVPTVTPNAAGSVDGAVHVMLFFSPTCPHCHAVRTETMPVLYQKYGSKLVVREFDVSQPYNFALQMGLEGTAGLPEDQQGYVPLAVVGRYLFTNAGTIQQGLDQVIQEYLDQGGVDWPMDAKLFADPGTAPNATPQVQVKLTETAGAGASSAGGSKTVRMAYFEKAGCQECSRAQYEINYLKSKYPTLDVTVFDIQGQAALNEWLCSKYNVPEVSRLTAPSIFIGQDYLVGKDVSTANIEKLIQKYQASGVASTWDNWEKEAPQAQSNIIERFKSFGLLTVILAALIDGLNPCAFATIVFFISYLAFAGRKGRDILLVGAAFALGVFITYLAVGLGLYQLLTRLPFLTTLGRWVYGITAALCVVLAVFSILDYFAARRGAPEEMRLRLPMKLRRRINTMIRESASAPALAGVALVSGFVISAIELACTGQVYLPTIIFVMGQPALRAQATLYLLLYNVIFILPLLVVFALAYFGTSSERLGEFINKHTTTIKLATAALFIVLAVWLIILLI